jgi:hypothetical protein
LIFKNILAGIEPVGDAPESISILDEIDTCEAQRRRPVSSQQCSALIRLDSSSWPLLDLEIRLSLPK